MYNELKPVVHKVDWTLYLDVVYSDSTIIYYTKINTWKKVLKDGIEHTIQYHFSTIKSCVISTRANI